MQKAPRASRHVRAALHPARAAPLHPRKWGPSGGGRHMPRCKPPGRFPSHPRNGRARRALRLSRRAATHTRHTNGISHLPFEGPPEPLSPLSPLVLPWLPREARVPGQDGGLGGFIGRQGVRPARAPLRRRTALGRFSQRRARHPPTWGMWSRTRRAPRAIPSSHSSRFCRAVVVASTCATSTRSRAMSVQKSSTFSAPLVACATPSSPSSPCHPPLPTGHRARGRAVRRGSGDAASTSQRPRVGTQYQVARVVAVVHRVPEDLPHAAVAVALQVARRPLQHLQLGALPERMPP